MIKISGVESIQHDYWPSHADTCMCTSTCMHTRMCTSTCMHTRMCTSTCMHTIKRSLIMACTRLSTCSHPWAPKLAAESVCNRGHHPQNVPFWGSDHDYWPLILIPTPKPKPPTPNPNSPHPQPSAEAMGEGDLGGEGTPQVQAPSSNPGSRSVTTFLCSMTYAKRSSKTPNSASLS